MSAVDITVLLALSVYQLVVENSLPVTSQSVPVFGQSADTKITLGFDAAAAAAATTTTTYY